MGMELDMVQEHEGRHKHHHHRHRLRYTDGLTEQLPAEEIEAVGAETLDPEATKAVPQEVKPGDFAVKLAELLQISEPHMSDIERGKTSGNILLIKNLATILEVSADWLLLVDNDKASSHTLAEFAELISDSTQNECEEMYKIMRQVKAAFKAVSLEASEN